MTHTHEIIDTDSHFIIDPVSRAITSNTEKLQLMQFDHNSERLTFEIPRMIEGHDMSLCNVIEIHYINIDPKTRERNSGVYRVDDASIADNNGDEVLMFSWLISQNVTKSQGAISFLIRLSCVNDDGTIEYAWNSGIYQGISVQEGIYNSEEIAEVYADILEQWRSELFASNGCNINQILDPDNYPLSESESVSTTVPISMEIGGLSRTDGSETDVAEYVRATDYFPVESGNTYVFTNSGDLTICVLLYDSNYNFIEGWNKDGETAYSYAWRGSGGGIDIPSGAAYIRFYCNASNDLSVEYTITNESGISSSTKVYAEFVKQYFRNHGYTIYGDNIDDETMHKLVIEALGLDNNAYNIVEIKAPISNPDESTVCLMNWGNGRKQFVDVSSMVYDVDNPTVEVVCQTRGGKKLPEFSVRYNDGNGAGRVKKFVVKPDAIPMELTADGLKVRKNNNFDNDGTDDDYIVVNFANLLDRIATIEQQLGISS